MEDEFLRNHRLQLRAARQQLFQLPSIQYFEIAGRPSLVYQIRDYSQKDSGGAAQARQDVPFLFKAFETGQVPPPRFGTKRYLEARPVTIHEYLDWTVTAVDNSAEDEIDFSGFRVVALLPRYKPHYPPPLEWEPPSLPVVAPRPLGAPADALPVLMVAGKAYCAAAIRLGIGYMEVPFFATHAEKRHRGYGRALLEAIEEMARAMQIPRILLCSTDEPATKNTWRSLGFMFSTDEDLQSFGVHSTDLLHMDNTVQMHKEVPPPRRWRSLVVKHESFAQRVYYPADGGIKAAPGGLNPLQVKVGGVAGGRNLPAAAAEAAIRQQAQQAAREREMGVTHFPPPANIPAIVPLTDEGKVPVVLHGHPHQSLRLQHPTPPHRLHQHQQRYLDHHCQQQQHYVQQQDAQGIAMQNAHLQQPAHDPHSSQQQKLQSPPGWGAQNGRSESGMEWVHANGLDQQREDHRDLQSSREEWAHVDPQQKSDDEAMHGAGLISSPVSMYPQPMAVSFARVQ